MLAFMFIFFGYAYVQPFFEVFNKLKIYVLYYYWLDIGELVDTFYFAYFSGQNVLDNNGIDSGTKVMVRVTKNKIIGNCF